MFPLFGAIWVLWQQLRHECRMVALIVTENFKNSDDAFVSPFENRGGVVSLNLATYSSRPALPALTALTPKSPNAVNSALLGVE